MRNLVVWLGAALAGASFGMAGARAASVSPADPQPADQELKPGLAVVYYGHFFRHIDEIVEWEKYKDGTPGEPILQVKSRVGLGKVLTSNSDDGVGAKMTGYIRLGTPGKYSFAFESNDGVRLEIDGQMVVEDPNVHADRFSDLGSVQIETPGWYPITIRYFERKNTSTLMFHWLPPGTEGSMPLVPGDVLAHKHE